MENEYIKFTIGEKKDIALIAHDNEKPKLIEWCKENYDILKKHKQLPILYEFPFLAGVSTLYNEGICRIHIKQ